MAGQEIPSEQWVPFFDDFSKRHDSWVVELELLGADIGDQEATAALPLVGISADMKDGERRIEIACGYPADVQMTHIINNPKRVMYKPRVTNADEAIEIEAEDSTTTLLQFRHVLPEQPERQLPTPA